MMNEVVPDRGADTNPEASLTDPLQKSDQVMAELVINGTIELSAESVDVIPPASKLLPYGMAVYVPHLPGRPLEENLVRVKALHAAGFDPVPHIAARSIASVSELRAYLDRAVSESNVHRLMIIGGDRAEAAGAFPDSAALIGSGILADAGIHEVDVAGYPEGHPRVPKDVLDSDLRTKLELTAGQGLGISIVTQFSFLPARIIEYCDELAHETPQVPIYVGMAGPTNPVSLLRFARHCGVSESLRALSALGVKAAKLACHTSPDEQLEVLARYCARHEVSNVIGIHVFSFGGFVRSAKWMRKKYR